MQFISQQLRYIRPNQQYAMDQLTQYRNQIDTIDTILITLLKERFDAVKWIGEYKKLHNMKPLQPGRWQEVLNSRIAIAEQNGLDPDLIREIWETIHKYALRIEEEV